ncbi:hypothetical protein HDE_02009 [Halotydeus destructor]|nr:hypothetical protein HDE_02009 [Halotydeus destructor]
MQKSMILLQISCAIAASYYILVAVIDYLSHETVTHVSFTNENSSSRLVVCIARRFERMEDFQLSDFSHVERYLGEHRFCYAKTHGQGQFPIPIEVALDTRIYALQKRDFMPWELSRSTYIYDAFADVPVISTGIAIYITFEKLLSKLMPAPYDTNCHFYNQYECIYDCSQTYLSLEQCSESCSKPSCDALHYISLGHTVIGGNVSSEIVTEERASVQSIVAEAKMSLQFIVLNVLGLIGVFTGFSVLTAFKFTCSYIIFKQSLARKITFTACFCCALWQCLFVVYDHFEYRHNTECYVGSRTIPQPRPSYSLCHFATLGNNTWQETMKQKLTNEIYSLQIAQYDTTILMNLRDIFLKNYETKYVEYYTVNGKVCFLLRTPLENLTFEAKDRNQYMFQDRELTIRPHNSDSVFEISVHIHDHDITWQTSGLKAFRLTALKKTYLKTTSLPHPYKTKCQRYGEVTLLELKSRSHCINVCALNLFKANSSSNHPLKIPLFNKNDSSHITGDATQYLEICRRVNCRWNDCENERFESYILQHTSAGSLNMIAIESPGSEVYQFSDIPLSSISDTGLLLISTVGFWTGISMVETIKFVGKLVRRATCKRFRRRATKRARLLVLIIGFAWNFFSATEKYLAYETLSQTYSQPALSLSPVKLVFGQRLLGTECVYGGLCSSAEIDELISSCIAKSRETLLEVVSRDVKTLAWLTMLNSNRDLKTNRYLYFYNSLITELNPRISMTRLNVEMLIASGSMAVMEIRFFSVEPLYFFVLHGQDVIDMDVADTGFTAIYPDYHVVYDYAGIRISSLPAPYHLDCVDYRLFGHTNRRACYFSCQQKLLQDTLNRTTTLLKPLPIEHISEWTDDEIGAKFLVEHDHPFKCSQICKKSDCYSNTVRKRQSSIGIPGNGTKLTLNAQKHETSIRHVSKMSMSELILYLGNTFGIWYGFCALDIIKPLGYLEGLILVGFS